jgi:hypothetical protein
MARQRHVTWRWWRYLAAGTFVVAFLVGLGAPKLLATARTGRSARGASSSTSITATTKPMVEPEPETTPGRVFVAGDSLTFTASWDHGSGKAAPDDLEWAAWLGWTAADVQPQLDAAVAQAQVDALVVALGTNDSSPDVSGGWTEADVAQFQHLVATAGSSACVVIVLPGYGDGIDSHHAAEMDEARADLLALADERRRTPGAGPTVVADWQAVVDANPDLLADDGIHLAPDPVVTDDVSAEAATARTTLYWQGVDACP